MAPSNPLDDFESRVYADCCHAGLFPPQSKILLAVSGGPDSTALLHAFLKLSKQWGLTPDVAHLNHKTRNGESDGDAEFVRQLAEANGLPCHIRECNVKLRMEREGGSFQEKARLLRQTFFDELAEDEGYAFIVLGHHADDQAETVLLNLLRGAGPLGLAGMPFRRERVVRPFLNRSRDEILQYLERHRWPFREDSSNKDTRYLRNRTRLELIPHLQKNYSPGLISHLLQASRLLQQDEEYLAGVAADLFERIHEHHGEGVFLPVGELDHLHVAVLNRVLRRAVHKVKGNLQAVEFSHIQSVAGLIPEGVSGAVMLPGDIRVSREPGGLYFMWQDRNRTEPPAGLPVKIRLNVPGTTEIAPVRLAIRAEVNPSSSNYRECSPTEAFLDRDRVGATVWVRFAQPGDRFWPLGGPGSKKLKSFFVDQKVPVEERWNTPILTDAQGHIIWVYGRRISDRFKVVPETSNILYLKGVK